VPERLTDQLPERSVADTTGHHDERLALIAALHRLGPRQRAVVVLRYWVGLTETEAAVTLGCSVGARSAQVAPRSCEGPHSLATTGHKVMFNSSPAKWRMTTTGPRMYCLPAWH
jgi:hypothetical protein